MFTFIFFAVAVRGSLPDPLVAHSFQWAIHEKQIRPAVRPAVNSIANEGVRILTRDGLALIDFALETKSRPELVIVGLRNLIASSAAKDVSNGLVAATDTLCQLIDEVKQAAFTHSVRLLAALENSNVYKRLIVRAALVDVNAFITGVVSKADRLRDFNQHFSFIIEELQVAMSSISVKTINAISDPLGSALRSLQRVVKKTQTLSLPRSRPTRTYNLEAMEHFLTSPVYAEVAQEVEDVDVSLPEETWLAAFMDLHIYEDLINIIEDEDDQVFSEDVRAYLTDALTTAALLFEEPDLVQAAKALVEMRSAMLLAMKARNSRFLIDKLRAELYRMTFMFASRFVDPIGDRLAHHPLGESLRVSMTALLPKVIARFHPSVPNFNWLMTGDEQLTSRWTEATVAFLRASTPRAGVPSDLAQLLAERASALNILKPLFHHSSPSSL